MTQALLKEIQLQKDYLKSEQVKTIYFGGGTPSLLLGTELAEILNALKKTFPVVSDAEITLEANPDDIEEVTLHDWKQAGINRLSIGIQSFYEEDLRWMNRAHTADQALDNLLVAKKQFDNITIDLIYGSPGLTDEKWKHNVYTAISLGIPHLSCYALTVEPKTPLHKLIEQNKSLPVDAARQSSQFLLLMDWMADAGYEHYEISNFALPGWRSRHNSSYWQGQSYLGIGPSAHSFDGLSRQWNVSNNRQYMDAIENGKIAAEKEVLTEVQKTNEYIMTSLRTIEGLDFEKIATEYRDNIMKVSKKYLDRGMMVLLEDKLVLTREGKLFADGIAGDLFIG